MTETKKKRHAIKFGVPQAVLASVAIVTFGAVYVLAPDESRGTIESAVLAVWAVVSTFLGPMIRRAVDEGGDA